MLLSSLAVLGSIDKKGSKMKWISDWNWVEIVCLSVVVVLAIWSWLYCFVWWPDKNEDSEGSVEEQEEG